MGRSSLNYLSNSMLSFWSFILYYLWFSLSYFDFLIPKEIHIDMQGTAHNMRLGVHLAIIS